MCFACLNGFDLPADLTCNNSAAGDRVIHFPDAFIPLLSERKRDAEKCFGITFRHSLSSPLPACNCSPTPLLKELSFMSTAKGEARRTQLTHLAQDENEGEWGKCLPVCVCELNV